MKFLTKPATPIRSIIFLLGIFALSTVATAQNTLTLEECYALARQNYPLTRQHDLIGSSKEYSIANVSKGYLPKIVIAGQATYQSEVTKFPISVPGFSVPEYPKDQYKIYGEISQPLTDLFTVHQQSNLQENASSLQEENLEVELYKLKDRINQLYFGILLIDEQISANELLKKDIQTGITTVNAGIKNGVAFKTSLDKLTAELLRANQHGVELLSSRKAYADMLGLFINKTLDSGTVFEKPQSPGMMQTINRPELKTFALQRKSFAIQDNLVLMKNIPKVELFFQGGYGKPSPVNLFSTDLSSFYFAGVRLSWLFSNLYTFSSENQINEINRKMVDAQQETFLFNTNLALKQQEAEIAKLQELLNTDNDIVNLRVSIKNTAKVQLENGVITENDYLKEINSEDQARQSKLLHEIQLLMAQYNYKNTSGN